MASRRFKLVFFCPADKTHRVLEQLFGRFPGQLGRIGNYEQCAFLTKGIGQFKPVGAANPAIGEVGQLEHIEEHRVEISVRDSANDHQGIKDIISELKKVHPYEEVAYDVYQLMDF
ncbi:unnamed protein product [Peniophora sp. CBMAI 1063]|nr:unnamed protein product [Peniophora sp. CBMAI 1063]